MKSWVDIIIIEGGKVRWNVLCGDECENVTRIMGQCLGLDKICQQNFEQNRQPKEISNSASKMGCQFYPTKQNRKTDEILYSFMKKLQELLEDTIMSYYSSFNL